MLPMQSTTEESIIDAHHDGLIEGVYAYAYWKDGIMYVGTCGKTFKQAVEEIEASRDNMLKKLYKQSV